MGQWQEIATLIASIAIILGAVGATARWAVKGTIEAALRPVRNELHAIGGRLARVEESIKHLVPRG